MFFTLSDSKDYKTKMMNFLTILCLFLLLSTHVNTQDESEDYNQYPDDVDMVPPEIRENYPEAPPQNNLNDYIMNHLIEVVMMIIIVFLLSVIIGISCCFAELKRVVIENNIDHANNNMEMQQV